MILSMRSDIFVGFSNESGIKGKQNKCRPMYYQSFKICLNISQVNDKIKTF